jgi:hypothetical protein
MRYSRAVLMGFVVTFTLSVVPTVLAQVPGPGPEGHPLWDVEPDIAKQWDALRARAGHVTDGLALVAHALPNSLRSPEAVTVVVSIVNVSDRPIALYGRLPAKPFALVQSEGGRLIEATAEGHRLRESPRFISKPLEALLLPGYAHGELAPIGEYFALSEGHRYTVLLADSMAAWEPPSAPQVTGGQSPKGSPPSFVDLGGMTNADLQAFRKRKVVGLVSPPVALHVAPARGCADGNASSGISASDKRVWIADRTAWTEDDWSNASTVAGRLHRGCVLEVIVNRDAAGAVQLVTSLIFLEKESRDDPFVTGTLAADYVVAVRDPNGRLLPMTSFGRQMPKSPRPGSSSVYMQTGDAIGALFPLTRCYDMATPGEYAVLVGLPSPTATDSLVFAKPLRVKVEAKPAVPKQ